MIKKLLATPQGLRSLDERLQFVGKDVKMPFGTIDILARNNSRQVSIKVKEGEYVSSSLIGHIHQYRLHTDEVYVVAPHITAQLRHAFDSDGSIHLVGMNNLSHSHGCNYEMGAKPSEGMPRSLSSHGIDYKAEAKRLLVDPLLTYAKRKLLP